MFGDNPPTWANTSGARWNPRDIEAIYSSCERETALAEAEFQISLQPVRPSARRVLYTIRLSLKSVVDLRDPSLLQRFGLTEDLIRSSDYTACQEFGGAVQWLGHDGLLVPSARNTGGVNLVIYLQNLATSVFEVVDKESIPDRGGRQPTREMRD